eukprot:Lithocolla_globosa_v1_NODE_561_length_3748_cov_3.799350.p3 type:complete len:119 gc:universal NODE_561_length_3748_cov_3.799350:407-51(-)
MSFGQLKIDMGGSFRRARPGLGCYRVVEVACFHRQHRVLPLRPPNNLRQFSLIIEQHVKAGTFRLVEENGAELSVELWFRDQPANSDTRTDRPNLHFRSRDRSQKCFSKRCVLCPAVN